MREMKDSGIEWIGEIPQTWNVIKTKYNFTHKKIIAGIYADKFERLALTMNGVIKRSKEDSNGLQPEKFETYQLLQKDELVFKLIDLQNISTSRVGLSPYDGLVSPAYIIIKATGEVLPTFAEKFFLSMWKNQIFNAMGDSGVRSSLNSKDLLDIHISVPPLPEQHSIAAYLDTKCSEIDALVADIQKQIDTLEEYKHSVITEAVTKGLDRDVEMRDSGIAWIGEIPEHWDVCRIASLYEERNERGNDELPLLSVSIKTGVSDSEVSDEDSQRIFVRSEDRTKYKRVYPQDLTYNMMRAWQGAFGAVRVEGMVSPAYVVAKPKIEIESRYMEALLRTPSAIQEMHRYSYGVADFRLRLYWDKFRTIKVCFPPLQEQKAIADYIDDKVIEIDTLISEKKQQIATIEEYKKSLIFEYVTGKKEVKSCPYLKN